jgi:3-oxoacyl-[acyl-carrier-protein] synthase-3
MDGAEVFAFTLKQVPPLMKEILSASGWTLDTLDAFVPHQANLFMLQHLGKRMKLPAGKLILDLEEFGNTSSASIPLALSHQLAPRLRQSPLNLILAGFGVGWSWGAVAATCGPMVMPDILYLDQPTG